MLHVISSLEHHRFWTLKAGNRTSPLFFFEALVFSIHFPFMESDNVSLNTLMDIPQVSGIPGSDLMNTFEKGFKNPWPRVWNGLWYPSGLTVTFWPVSCTSSPTWSCLTLLAHLVFILVCKSQMGILNKTWMFSSTLTHFYKWGLVIKISQIKTTINILTHQYNMVSECIKNQKYSLYSKIWMRPGRIIKWI